MRTAVVREAGEVSCLILPLDECDLLLPNDCIAEVLPWRRVKPPASLPRWCTGTLVWRGHTVAVIDFGVISGLREQPRLNRRALVVLNRITMREGSAFYALACAGLPRILRATEEELRETVSVPVPQAGLAALRLGSETAVIPDLQFIEDLVNQAL